MGLYGTLMAALSSGQFLSPAGSPTVARYRSTRLGLGCRAIDEAKTARTASTRFPVVASVTVSEAPTETLELTPLSVSIGQCPFRARSTRKRRFARWCRTAWTARPQVVQPLELLNGRGDIQANLRLRHNRRQRVAGQDPPHVAAVAKLDAETVNTDVDDAVASGVKLGPQRVQDARHELTVPLPEPGEPTKTTTFRHFTAAIRSRTVVLAPCSDRLPSRGQVETDP